jgi:hypothetical protein
MAVTVTPTLTISQTPPSSPAVGDLWWNSSIGVFFLYYDDGTSVQWVTTQPVKYINIATISGPAGGDLDGYYPDPVVEDNVVLEYPSLRNPLGLPDYSQKLASSKWVTDKFATFGLLGQVSQGPGILLTPNPLAGDCTIALRAISSPPTGTYGGSAETPVITVDQYGRITVAAGAAIPPIASPVFTGVPRAPTAAPLTDTTQIATTQWTNAEIVVALAPYATLASPVFTGDPKAPTPGPGDNDTSIATTAWVTTALGTALGAYAPLASPTFTGDPKAPTPSPGDNDTSIATTAFIVAALAAYAPLASPVLTGNPTAPTPSPGDNDTSISTTAFVVAALAAALTAYAPLASPTFTGDPKAPTPSPGDNDTSIATTAFIVAALAAYAPLASPVLTGNPTAPTPSPGDADTSIATTAFVATSFAPLASPTLTGDPKAPTPSPGDNDTSIATTAFVNTAVGSALTVPRSYLAGLGMSRSSTTVLAVAAGTTIDSTNAAAITLAAFTKSTAGSWVAGTGNNGMGVGLTIANTTTYHVFAILVGGAADVYFDTSVTAANKPVGTTNFRRIGSFRTNGSAQIINFVQDGDDFSLVTPVRDINSNNPGIVAVTSTLASIPTGIRLKANVQLVLVDGSSTYSVTAILTDLSTDDIDPTPGTFHDTPLAITAAGGVLYTGGRLSVWTNTSAQIRSRVHASGGATDASTTLIINTLGWTDRRGRDS